MIRQHLEVLFGGCAGFVPVRVLKEKNGIDARGFNPFVPCQKDFIDRVVGHAEKAAERRLACFVVPGTVANSGRAKAEDIVQIATVLVDLDSGDIAAARRLLEAYLGEPTLVIASGGLTDDGQERLHLYWRLNEVAAGEDLVRLCALRGDLAAKVGGDPSFASAHQPIRLAGSIYGKGGVRRLVRIIAQSDTAYALGALCKAASEMPQLPGVPQIDTGIKRRKGPRVADLQIKTIHEGGVDEVTRFQAIGKVCGHWINLARSGRISLSEAWLHVLEHNAANISPPWDEARLRESFDAILKRDIEKHGPMPEVDLDDTPNDGTSSDGDDHGSYVPPSPPEPFSEDDIADRFAARYRNRLRFVAARGRWMRWNGKVWVADETAKTLELVRRMARAAAAMIDDRTMSRRLCSEKLYRSVEKIARSDPRMAEAATVWDRGDMVINTPSGLLDLETGYLREAAPADLVTRMAGASPGGECPRWDRFLMEVTGDDAEMVAYLQRVAGYCLTGSMKEQVFFFLQGSGANGKSIFISVLTAILGDYAASAPLGTFASVYGDKHPTDLAGIASARAVFVTETEAGKPWAESRIKAITGGDKLSVRFLYKDFFEVQPSFKIVVAGNARPRLVGVGEAMKRRLHLIPFNVTIPPEQRDKDLLQTLLNERNGIFAWALKGCAQWQRIGLAPPETVLSAAVGYFQDEDIVGQWIEECCATGPQFRAPSLQLYKAWSEWADARGYPVGTQRALGEELRTRGYIQYRTGRERGWQGLRPLIRDPLASAEAA